MRFRCNACVDESGRRPRLLEFESDRQVCPRCGASGPPLVAALIDVHLVVMDPKGAIQAASGRQYVACSPKRPYFGIDPLRPYSATGEVSAVTCPRCKGTKEYLERARALEEVEEEVRAAQEQRKVVVDMGGG